MNLSKIKITSLWIALISMTFISCSRGSHELGFTPGVPMGHFTAEKEYGENEIPDSFGKIQTCSDDSVVDPRLKVGLREVRQFNMTNFLPFFGEGTDFAQGEFQVLQINPQEFKVRHFYRAQMPSWSGTSQFVRRHYYNENKHWSFEDLEVQAPPLAYEYICAYISFNSHSPILNKWKDLKSKLKTDDQYKFKFTSGHYQLASGQNLAAFKIDTDTTEPQITCTKYDSNGNDIWRKTFENIKIKTQIIESFELPDLESNCAFNAISVTINYFTNEGQPISQFFGELLRVEGL